MRNIFWPGCLSPLSLLKYSVWYICTSKNYKVTHLLKGFPRYWWIRKSTWLPVGATMTHLVTNWLGTKNEQKLSSGEGHIIIIIIHVWWESSHEYWKIGKGNCNLQLVWPLYYFTLSCQMILLIKGEPPGGKGLTVTNYGILLQFIF